MKRVLLLYFIEGFILLFSILLKTLFLTSKYNTLINFFCWLVVFLILYFKYKIPKDKNFLKNNTIRIVIITLFSYFIITYSLGLILGFSRNIFSLKITSIIKNIFLPLSIIVLQELIRFIYAKNISKNIKPYIFLTIVYIISTIIYKGDIIYFNNGELIFKFICLIVIPTICFESLYSYITYKVSYIPTLLIKIVFELSAYILPIFPNLGDYISSVLGVIYPAIVYFLINKSVSYYDKKQKILKKHYYNLFTIPLLIVLSILVILISGIFRYKLIAIGSGSMEPIYYKGDGIIYDKKFKVDKLTKGTIIAFKKDSIIVTHRIVDIAEFNNKYYFKTKGDNNDNIDNFIVEGDKIQGVVVYKIPYIGRPTLWLNNILKG